MKKILTIVAAVLMAATAMAKTETVSSFDFLAWATEHLAEGNDGRKNLAAAQFTAGDKFVGQTFYAINEADTLPNPDFQLFPNKEWTLTRVYTSGNLQIGIRATRNSEVKNMFGFKNMKQDMKVIVFSQSATLLASTEDVASVESEDVTINFNYGAKDRSETAKKTTFTLLKDADLAIAFDKDNIIYSVEVTAEVDDSEYELQTLVEYSAGAVQSGNITAVGTAVLDQSAKYNSNSTACTVISFPNSYSKTENDVTTYCYAEVSVEGGFKAGDSLTIQPFTAMSTADFTGGSKYANIEFRAITGEVEAAAVNLTGSTAASLTVTDGHEEAGDPKTFGYVFTADCDAFRLSRQGGTRINLLSMSVVRLVKKEEEPVVETAYFLKNNWNGGEWSWNEMTKDGEIYKLDSVVFGGSGVNLNTAADDADSKWIPVADIQGDDIQANDTVSFTLAISETDTVLTAILIGRPEQPVDVTYYLTGTFNTWATADENYLFVANPEVEGEYILNVTLTVGDGIKVVSSTGTWYPDGMGNEYTVDEAHAGEKVVYFRPVANDEWKTFHSSGFFFIEENSTPEGIENVQDSVQATKLIENGQLYIMYKGVKYNVQGVKQ